MTTTTRRAGRRGPSASAPASPLLDQIRPRQHYLRAANLERHQDQTGAYIPTGRALEVVRRLLHAVNDPNAGRAWSLTGPYGAGKSSFALYLHSLLGPVNERRDRAEQALREADPALIDTLVEARVSLGSGTRGFVLATTTCQAEPLTDSILRALVAGAHAYWPKRRPEEVRAALETASAVRNARALAHAIEQISAYAPVLIILDEFGKILEHFSDTAITNSAATTDLFVLQEIAERASGGNAIPAFLFTLQHLAFDDYVRNVSVTQRREWGKVQGRFEDVSFLETTEQSLRLVAGALDDANITSALSKRRESWAQAAFEQIRQLGIASHVPGGSTTLASCYPMHPTALLALPELCARLGQHGRTLFTFLASTERHTATDFLANNAATRTSLPVIAISQLYDFFSGPGHAVPAGIGGARWTEIVERIREASDLSPADVACLKTVGLLNLVGHISGLRASADIVSYSLGSGDQIAPDEWRGRLVDLESRGWLTYRGFADEYRLWQGSDVDLRGRVSDAREQLRNTSPAALLTRLQAAAPLIAGKHSQRVGMLRYFAVSYADGTNTTVPALASDDPADGTVVYYLDDASGATLLRSSGAVRPIVLATSDAVHKIRTAAIETAAALAVLDQQDVVNDNVARRELQDRVADARTRLTSALADSFRPGAVGVRWQLLTDRGLGKELHPERGLSRLLSEVCEESYCNSPEIRNEMLGRRELTSQGAKARRNLLEAMTRHTHTERLGLKGFGPERAMYDAVLHHTGIHREESEGNAWSFAQPNPGGTLGSVWGVMAQTVNPAQSDPVGVDEIYTRLMAPPVGLKDGPIPVFLAAFLLHRSDDVAIYEDGTYQPTLTADLLERLVKAPHRFALKAFSTAGTRNRALTEIRALTARLGEKQPRGGRSQSLRNTSVLATASPLMAFARGLPDYTRYTGELSGAAVAVRRALLTAREPDVLLFKNLPEACGIPSMIGARKAREDDVARFAGVLQQAFNELRDAYSNMLVQLGVDLAQELNLPGAVGKYRYKLAARAETLEGRVLDPKLRTFLFTASDTSLDDEAWLEAVGLAVADRPPVSWRDDDAARFNTNLKALVGAFRRVEALHFDVAASTATEGFTASRLTRTAPDGHESSRVIYADDASHDQLRHIAEQALQQAQKQCGPQGRDGLLALLSELVLTTPATEATSIRPRHARSRSAKSSSGETSHG